MSESLEIAKAAATVFSPVAVAGLGWWLAGRFRAVENKFQDIMIAHEAKDQQRHVDNLGKFTEVTNALSAAGLWNGVGPRFHGKE